MIAAHLTPARSNRRTISTSFLFAAGLLWICSRAAIPSRPSPANFASRDAKAVRWKYRTGGKIFSSPLLYRNMVVVGSEDHKVYALDTASGSLIWQFATRASVDGSPVVWDDKVFIGSYDGNLYALAAGTGQLQWKFRTGGERKVGAKGLWTMKPVFSGNTVYFGSWDRFLYALDTATGKAVWTYSANNSWILTTATAADGVVYFGTSDTYLLVAVDAATGNEKFRAKANGYVYSSPVIDDTSVYFGDFSGQMLTVNRLSGKIEERWFTPGRSANGPALLKQDTLDFAYATKGMDLTEYATTVVGMRRLYSLGPIVGKPALGRHALYFGSGDSCIYALNRY